MPADDHQGHPRHQRPAARRGRGARRVRDAAARELSEMSQGRRSTSSSPSWRPRCAPPPSELEFERAAALRDEIQDIRLRVLEEDASVAVLKAAERAAAARNRRREAAAASRRSGWRPCKSGERRGRRGDCGGGAGARGHRRSTVLPAEEEPAATPMRRARPRARRSAPDEGTAADWLPGHPRRARGRRRRAGWRAGSTVRPGTCASRRT